MFRASDSLSGSSSLRQLPRYERYNGGDLRFSDIYSWRSSTMSTQSTGSQTASKSPSSARFASRTALVTGAAGDIGKAAALRFIAEGANVVLVDLSSAEERLGQLAQEVGAERSLVVTADVTKRSEVEKAFAEGAKRFGRVDFVFNNAGIQGNFQSTEEYDETNFRQVLEVNVVGVFIVLQAASKAMLADEQGGIIVNTASLAGLQGPPNMVAYSAAKHAVIGMTRTASKDLAGRGIRVCAVCPGLLEGRMWGTQVEGQAKCTRLRQTGTPLSADLTDEEFRAQEQKMIGRVPIGRRGTAEEVASVVAFLCSDDASYVTGTTITIDGGALH